MTFHGMPTRVVVFIDVQNTYRGARDIFFPHPVPHIEGQFDPKALGDYIAGNAPIGQQRILHDVRAYTGRPAPDKDPKSYGAHMKQCAAWEAMGVTVIPRPLRYPRNWPHERPQEKGIDVKLAIDFVAMAVNDEYDVGVIMSVDTDLTPALEFVVANTSKVVEVAAWRGPARSGRLSVKSRSIWCHWLERSLYDRFADSTNYTR